MPEHAQKLDLALIEDPSGSEIKVIEHVKTEWCKELLVKSRGHKQSWGNFLYITGPIEAREVSEFIRDRIEVVRPVLEGQNLSENGHSASFLHRSKKLNFRISGNSETRKISFCWSSFEDPNSLLELAYIIENWRPEF